MWRATSITESFRSAEARLSKRFRFQESPVEAFRQSCLCAYNLHRECPSVKQMKRLYDAIVKIMKEVYVCRAEPKGTDLSIQTVTGGGQKQTCRLEECA